MSSLSDWVLPTLVFLTVLYGQWKGAPVFDAFVEGAKAGLEVAIRLLPTLVGMLCALTLLQRSGLLALILGFLAPPLQALGIPVETAPLMLLRPFSGSASLSMLSEIMRAYGPDSRVGRVACAMMGSSETAFYTVCVYLGAVGVKRSRYIIPCALVAWLVGGLAAAWLTG